MKMKVFFLAAVLLVMLLIPALTADAAVRGANLSGYWDLNFGDKTGRMTLGESATDKYGWGWHGDLVIYSVKRYPNKTTADWNIPIAMMAANVGGETEIVQELRPPGGTRIALCKVVTSSVLSCSLSIPEPSTSMYGDGRDNWWWNGKTTFSAQIL